jgi:hypothetical protein
VDIHPGDKNTSKDLKLPVIGLYLGFHRFLVDFHFFYQVLLATLISLGWSQLSLPKQLFWLAGIPVFVPSSKCGDITTQFNLQSNNQSIQSHF